MTVMFVHVHPPPLGRSRCGEQDHFKQNNCVSTALLTFESMLNEAGAGWAGGWGWWRTFHGSVRGLLRARLGSPLFTCKFNVR